MLICAHCGGENPDGARFCNACGAAFEAVPDTRPEVRKVVTVLFTDVTGSTALGERLDPESLRRLMLRYFESLTAVIERHGGTVEKFIGDAVMAVFGIPVAHEDDALRAVRAAVDVRGALASLNDEITSRHGVTIQVRTGVNTGEVVAGDATSRQAIVTGDTVNVAARLEQAAGPGEILIGAETHALVRDAVAVEAVAPLALKGKTEPVAAFRLAEVHAGVEGRERRMDAPMVGRDRPLRLLRETFDAAVSDRTCHLFTVLGPAGVGKSRLVEEFVHDAEGDATILRGRCLSYGEGITFRPIGEAVAQAAGIGPTDSGEQARTKIARLLGGEPGAAAIAERVGGITGLADVPSAPDETFWAIRKLLEAIARTRPLVLVLDDLHWGEPTLLDAVDHVADWTRDAPIMLLCMARPELLDERPAWGGGKLNASTILLEPLSDENSARLMSHLLGGAAIAADAGARIVQSAEGNPLFVEEVLSMLIDDGLLRRVNGHWEATSDLSSVRVPTSIRALLTARLDRLAPEERLVIERASVEGKTFHRGAVATLCDRDVASRVDGHLMTLVRKELVRPEAAQFPGEDGFAFRHLLIRDAAYDALPKETRGELHLRFADWLQAATGARLAEYQEILAYHLERTVMYRRELGLVDDDTARVAARAARHLASARQRASDLGDRWAVANLIDRELQLIPDDDARRTRLMIDLAGLQRWLGDLPRATELLDEAIAIARAAGDELAEAHAVLERYEVASMLAAEGATEESRADVERLLPIFEERGDRAGIARAWLTIGETEWMVGRYDRAREACERAATEASAAGLAGAEIARNARHSSLGAAYYGSVPVVDGIRLCRALFEREDGDLTDRSFGLALLASFTAIGGDIPSARRLWAESFSLSEDLGLWFALAAAYEQRGMIEELAGDLPAAELAYRRAFEMLIERGDVGHASTSGLRLAHALIGLGRPEEAEDLIRRCEALSASDDVVDLGLAAEGRARILAARGETTAATDTARRAVEIFGATEQPREHGQALMTLSEVLLAAGERQEARAVAVRSLEIYERKGVLIAADGARRLIERIDAGT